jgi:hypothetical protein
MEAAKLSQTLQIFAGHLETGYSYRTDPHLIQTLMARATKMYPRMTE